MRPTVAADGAWLAPAKLNLMLRVTGRRPDGYHLLQTVFQFVDRCDRLYFQPRDDGRIVRRRGPHGVDPEQDLVVRAARALQTHAQTAAGVEIDIEKVLPMGGGLGGGSSNAATTLQALNLLWDLGLEDDVLARIGLTLGADVPVFVRGHAAWAEGVGEHLHHVDLPEPYYLILVPPQSVATAAVFSDPDLTRNSPAITMADFLGGNAVNDCLNVVLKRYPVVAEAFRWLDGVSGGARLTGTGCCVFAVFDGESDARAAAALAPSGVDAFVARGCNRSPLFERPSD
ncbi:MAG: 4-(cytidine 5'-diphospho)-2-C-methyl-D-erythritol kinase [Thiohalocapsa sp.]|nr:4-(cytidine 5'-diphospho)-2-C-methyl-D-erythritol kinase [Thiohalocapsa sp.]